MKKKIVKIAKNKKNMAAKVIAPKIVTAFANIIRLGPRMIFRSTIELMRANLITRILSCFTLLIIDLVDLTRKRISPIQFSKNVILSAMLVVSGTIGWDLGSQWIVIEFFGSFVDIAGGIIGAGILSFVSNLTLDKVSGKLIESDAQKMWCILDPIIDMVEESQQEHVRDHITCTCLKKMYASKNREQYAIELVYKLTHHKHVDGHLRAEYHKH
jgi:hypothetical protein